MLSSSQKIRRISRLLKIAFIFSSCALPLLNAGFWITDGYPFLKPWLEWNLLPYVDDSVLPMSITSLSPHIKFLSFLVTMIPTALNMAAFLFLARLFKSYEQLEIFSVNAVQCVKRVGICILCNQLVYPIYFALLTLVLTISNPPGSRIIATAIELEQITMGAVGVIILLISWVMEKGRELQEEQAGTI